MKQLISVVACLGLTACSLTPPPQWATGGARLMIARAYWERGEHDRIEIRDDGGVYEDDDLVFTIDRVGRVVDDDYEPFALLYDNGIVLGPERRRMGRVGLHNASAPGDDHAWVSLQPDGRVIYYDPDGEQLFGGKWYGCSGPMVRTCTLVIHMFMMRFYDARRRSGPSPGFGFGIGIGL